VDLSVTALEACELTTSGGLIGGLAVNRYVEPGRRLRMRQKHQLDLIRLTETYPQLKALYPADLQQLLDRG
jgi:hypothetical protein